jgi:4-amino-4-deoxy-L-arabinose transferase-like glycosyltransferase
MPTTGRLSQRTLIILGAIFLFHLIHNLVYVTGDGRPPHFDQAYQVTLSLDMADCLAQRPFPALDNILDISGFYPPLLYLYTTPFYAWLGRSVVVARLSQLGFILILIFAVFGLGRRLGGEKVGLLSAALVSLYPIVFGTSRVFSNDLPLCAMVALALERLFASEGLTRQWPSIHFGLVCAAGFLVKWTFICFLLPPVLYVLLWETWQLEPWRRIMCGFSVRSSELKKPRFDLFAYCPWIAFLCCFFPAFPWYHKHSDYVWKTAGAVIEDMSILRGMPAITQPEAWTYYCATLLSHSMHLTLFTLALVALVYALRKGAMPRVLAVIFISQYIILSAIRHKDPRYFMPALPILAVLSAWWMLKCCPARYRRVLVALVLVVGVLQMEAVSWGSPLPREVKVGSLQVWKQHGYGSYEGWGEHWPLSDIVRIAARKSNGDGVTTVALVADHDYLHYEALNAYAKMERVPVRVVFAGNLDALPEQAAWKALSQDFILAKTGYLGLEHILNKLQPILDRLHGGGQDFNLPTHEAVAKWNLPDGSVATLFKRKAAAGFPARFGDVATLVSASIEDEKPPYGKRLRVVWKDVEKSRLEGVLVFMHLLDSDYGFIQPYSYPILPPDRTAEEGGNTEAVYSFTLPDERGRGTYRLLFGLWRPAIDGRCIPILGQGDSLLAIQEFSVP